MASSLSESGSPSGTQGPSPLRVNLPHFENLDVKTGYRSSRCGGDFFDGVALDFRLVFLLLDIAGRRPDTHAIAVDVQKVFRTKAQDLFKRSDANESHAIAELARDINRLLIEIAGVRFAPAFVGCYNLTLHVLTYLYAGHFLAIFHDGKKTSVVEPSGIPLGLFTHSIYEPAVLAFEQNARLLLVTEGIAKSQGPNTLDVERMRVLLENSAMDAASICDAVLKSVDDSEEHPKSRLHDFFHSRNHVDCDDMTAVVLVRR